MWALYVRRLHDLDTSGWWSLLSLLHIIGGFFIIFLAFMQGSPEKNYYGPPSPC